MDEEVPLAGGNINPAVVRVGDTVRRAQHPCNSTIHGESYRLKERKRAGLLSSPVKSEATGANGNR